MSIEIFENGNCIDSAGEAQTSGAYMGVDNGEIASYSYNDIDYAIAPADNGELDLTTNGIYESSAVIRFGEKSTIAIPEGAFSHIANPFYSITANPSWLKIAKDTGVFSGTAGKIPGSATGYGKTVFTVNATAPNGESSSMEITLTVIPKLIKGDSNLFNFSMSDLIAETLKLSNANKDENTFALSFNNVSFDLWDIQAVLSDISVSVTETAWAYDFKVRSSIGLSIFNAHDDDQPKVTIDFGSTEDKYIHLSTPHNFGSLQTDLVGDMTFENVVLGNGFKLNAGTLSVNTANKSWSGSASWELASLKGAEFSGEFEVVHGRVDSISVEVDNINIAVGNSGFFLNRLDGVMANISTPEDLCISGKMDFSFGSAVLDMPLLQLSITGQMSAESLSGTADISILNGWIDGDNVKCSLDMASGTAQLRGRFAMLNSVSVNSVMNVTGNTISLAGSTLVNYSKFGLNISVRSNLLLQYTNDFNDANDYIVSWAAYKKSGISCTIGVKVGLDNSFSLIFGEELTAAPEMQRSSSNKLRSAVPQPKQWQINKAGVVVISLESTTMLTGNEYFISINGNSVDAAVISQSDQLTLLAVEAQADDVVTLTYLNKNMEVAAYQQSTAVPELEVEYSALERKLLFSITEAIPENAQVSFYYDNNSSGYDGVLIGSSADGSCEWIVPDKLEGDFKFYAVITGEDIIPQYSEYSSDIEIAIQERPFELTIDQTYHYLVKGDLLTDVTINNGETIEINGGRLSGSCTLYSGGKLILTTGSAENVEFELSDSISIGEKFTLENSVFYINGDEITNSDYIFNSLNNFNSNQIIISGGSQDSFDLKLAGDAGDFTGSIVFENGGKTFSVACDGYRHIDGNRIVRLVKNSDNSCNFTIQELAAPENSTVWDDSLLESDPATAEYIVADDSNAVFQARANGVWSSLYCASYTNSAGLNETCKLWKKNKICDIFIGSEEANKLILTNDANGDALFIDDVFSTSFENMGESFSRLSKINSIHAGAGDDIVDLTSSKFDYWGNDMTICGGSGNDVIWANDNVANTLFGHSGNDRIVGGAADDIITGGSGNDRLHGGGGSDIFCFGANWGQDTIEQLDDGNITLLIESESGSWDAKNLTYTDGENQISIIGTENKNIWIDIIFADQLTAAELEYYNNLGVFANTDTEKLLENKNNGSLA